MDIKYLNQDKKIVYVKLRNNTKVAIKWNL